MEEGLEELVHRVGSNVYPKLGTRGLKISEAVSV